MLQGGVKTEAYLATKRNKSFYKNVHGKIYVSYNCHESADVDDCSVLIFFLTLLSAMTCSIVRLSILFS